MKLKNKERIAIYLIIALGILLRLIYILKTGCYERQHDVWSENGHIYYMAYIYHNNSLPDSYCWQFYQPPVWHIICALAMKLQNFLGFSLETATENLQLISFFWSSLMLFVSKKLFGLFGLTKKSLTISLSLVAFHPTLIILSGSLNNDCMSISLCLLAVFFAVKWYKTPNMKNILLLGLFLGLSMAVKVSGGLVSLAIALLFAARLFDKTQNKKQLLPQFLSFGLVCVPLGLWWQVRNYIRFHLPFTYVPRLTDKIPQYVGDYSIFQRLFDVSSIWKKGIYPAMGELNGSEFYEYNIFLGGLKSALFGEDYIEGNTFNFVLSALLLISAVLLIFVTVLSVLKILIKAVKNREKDLLLNIFPAISGVFLIILYIIFCFKYPHFCSMDFRYIAIISVFSALYVGLLSDKEKNNNKMFGFINKYFIPTITLLFCISSGLLYFCIS